MVVVVAAFLLAGASAASADDFDTDFENSGAYSADVTSNTATITNDGPGVWTGKVETNQGTINNNTGAAWIGEVESNAAYINLNPGATWDGDIAANLGRIANAGGTWTGDVLANGGDIINDNQDGEIGFGYWYGDVVTNSATVFNAGGGVWTGDVFANDGYIKNDLAGSWVGDVESNAGTIESIGTWNGNVLANDSVIVNDGGTWTGYVAANNGYIINEQLPDNSAGGHWVGDIKTNASTIRNGGGAIWTGNVLANAGDITNYSDSTWAGNVISNDGTISNLGIWNGNFTSSGTVNAENQINGSFSNSGLLHVTGDLSGITTLDNFGTLSLQGGGATQTLSAHAVSFGTDSFFDVDVDGAGNSDKLVADTAALAGTVRVSAATTGGSFATPYVIVSSAGITGTFAGVTADFAFLDPELSYAVPDTVRLLLLRNGQSFAGAGETPNQRATGAAVESLGAGNPIYDGVVWLTKDEADQAFDALSGEAYASVEGVYIQNASFVADAVFSHINQAFADADLGEVSTVSAYAEGPALPAGPARNRGLWGQVYGAAGSLSATGDTAGVDAETGGLIAGFDGSLGDWRLGLVAEAGVTEARVSALGSSTNSTDYGLGAYGGRQWGDTLLSLGGAYTRHDIHADRSVDLPEFTDDLSADYGAGTAQVFARLSHAFHFSALSLTPYGSVAYVSQATDGFSETGGEAALTSKANVVGAAFTTIGFGVDRKFIVPHGMLLAVTASVGWRHAFADAPEAINSFADGADFSVFGAPIASDVAVLSAGLNFDVGAGAALGISYDGQIGSGAETHAIRGTWSTQF